jgi:hypothetical protein
MIDGAIFPAAGHGTMSDETVDQIVSRAIASGLVACNAMTGPFRVAFFKRDRVPKGWARMGCVDKPAPKEPPCAA